MQNIDKIQLLTALQNGIGFSAACEVNLLSPAEVTAFMRGDKEFHMQCINAVKAAARGNLEHAQKLKNEKKFSEWQRQQGIIRSFIVDLTLWEDYCQKDQVTPDKVMRACHIYKTVEECATAIGYTKREFIEYVIDNDQLATYLSEKSIYNF